MDQKKLNKKFIDDFKCVNNRAYFEFIALNRILVNDPCYSKTKTHIHHIIPKYWFNDHPEYKRFQDCSNNLVILNHKDHITAHKILFQIYNDSRDQGAVFLLQNQFPKKSYIAKRELMLLIVSLN